MFCEALASSMTKTRALTPAERSLLQERVEAAFIVALESAERPSGSPLMSPPTKRISQQKELITGRLTN